MDLRYSAYGENVSPELNWSAAPKGTQSYALLLEDPDAQKPKPVVHWILYNLPSNVTHLREGMPGAPALADPKDGNSCAVLVLAKPKMSTQAIASVPKRARFAVRSVLWLHI